MAAGSGSCEQAEEAGRSAGGTPAGGVTQLVVVRGVGGPRYTEPLALAEQALRRQGHVIEAIEIAPATLPELDSARRATWEAFKHTPEALLEAWRVARHVEARCEPGATLLFADDRGVGGMVALEGTAGGRQRRAVWTVASDSTLLRWLAVADTIDGVPDQDAIDWELVQYRNSERVLALSDFAVASLARYGVHAERLDIALPEASPSPREVPGEPAIWLPEPVSRFADTATILRGLADVSGRIVASMEDADDGIWVGTAWEAMAPTRTPLGDRLARADGAPAATDLIVLGDVTAVPSGEVAAMRLAGARAVVPEGSTAAALWPDAETWRTADDLGRLVAGEATAEAPAIAGGAPRPIRPDHDRARSVSVGIPVFGTVAFLDEAVASVLAQTQAPLEVLLIDDGSQSAPVTESLQRWAAEPPVRSLFQANRGVCAARNTLLEAMAGDAFVLLDADDVLEPEFIERTAAALRSNDRLWAVATWTRFFGEYDGIEAKPPFDARVGRRENPIISTGALVDMAVREQGLRFADDLAFLYCEDWHFWSQIVAAGGEVGLVPEPLIRHRTHLASGAYQRTDLALSIGKARATAPLQGR